MRKVLRSESGLDTSTVSCPSAGMCTVRFVAADPVHRAVHDVRAGVQFDDCLLVGVECGDLVSVDPDLELTH